MPAKIRIIGTISETDMACLMYTHKKGPEEQWEEIRDKHYILQKQPLRSMGGMKTDCFLEAISKMQKVLHQPSELHSGQELI